MRKHFLKATLAVALLALPGQARADSPNLAGFTLLPTVFFAPLGVTSFDVQFLFGRAGLSGTLFYQNGAAGSWNKILTTTGSFPNQTASPAPGTVYSFGITGNNQEIKFALCTGNQASFPCAPVQFSQGPFFTGAVAPNVRALTGAQWNAEQASIAPDGATTTYSNVFAFEDKELANSDRDFNDVVFATNLSTVVPEPSSVLLMGAGLAALAFAGLRRKQIS